MKKIRRLKRATILAVTPAQAAALDRARADFEKWLQGPECAELQARLQAESERVRAMTDCPWCGRPLAEKALPTEQQIDDARWHFGGYT
jgi:hypothetical protein